MTPTRKRPRRALLIQSPGDDLGRELELGAFPSGLAEFSRELGIVQQLRNRIRHFLGRRPQYVEPSLPVHHGIETSPLSAYRRLAKQRCLEKYDAKPFAPLTAVAVLDAVRKHEEIASSVVEALGCIVYRSDERHVPLQL